MANKCADRSLCFAEVSYSGEMRALGEIVTPYVTLELFN